MGKEKKKVRQENALSYGWRGKLKSREEMLKYLQTAERYWYSDDWFGSEKRKNPA